MTPEERTVFSRVNEIGLPKHVRTVRVSQTAVICAHTPREYKGNTDKNCLRYSLLVRESASPRCSFEHEEHCQFDISQGTNSLILLGRSERI
jgi:hypothetical protein